MPNHIPLETSTEKCWICFDTGIWRGERSVSSEFATPKHNTSVANVRFDATWEQSDEQPIRWLENCSRKGGGGAAPRVPERGGDVEKGALLSALRQKI